MESKEPKEKKQNKNEDFFHIWHKEFEKIYNLTRPSKNIVNGAQG